MANFFLTLILTEDLLVALQQALFLLYFFPWKPPSITSVDFEAFFHKKWNL